MSSYNFVAADSGGAEDLVDKGKGKKISSLEDKHVPLLPPSSDSSSFLGDNFIPGHFYDIDHSNPPLNCPVQINCASFAKGSEKGEGSLSIPSIKSVDRHFNNKGFEKHVKNIPTLDKLPLHFKAICESISESDILAERRNSRIEENLQPNTNEAFVKTFLEQMCVLAILKRFGIGCLVHYLSMNLILQKKTSVDFWIQYMLINELINELKDYKENFEKTSIELHDLQEKYKLLVSKLEEKENHIQLQQEELQKRMHSAKRVSDETLKFSNDIIMHFSGVMNIVEEAQNETYQKLTDFENKFKEEAARDEEEAKHKISTILANFESKRVAMISEASKILQDANVQQSTILQEEMVNMQEFAEEAIKKVNEHVSNM